jgi:hypothetical protein
VGHHRPAAQPGGRPGDALQGRHDRVDPDRAAVGTTLQSGSGATWSPRPRRPISGI